MKVAEFISMTMALRTAAHLAHLKTRSYAAHMALQEFYEGVIELLDSYAETYQGLFAVLEQYPDTPVPSQDPLMFIVDYADWLRSNKDALASGETALANIIDEMIALSGRTIYKLRTLK